VITHSSGGITGRDVTNVAVTCIDNVTDPIVGTYAVPALMPGSLVYITLFADGVYVYGSVENNPGCGGTLDGNGVEYGVYNYNKTTGDFTIKSAVVDTNGGCGVWFDGARYSGSLTVSGTGQDKILTLTTPDGSFDLVPVASTASQIYGSWSNAYHKGFLLFLNAGGSNVHFFSADSRQESGDEDRGRRAGIEYACGTISSGTAASGALAKDYSDATCVPPQPDPSAPVNTDGTNGLDGDPGVFNFAVTDDSMDGDLGSMLRNVPN
jgi:hypothetical protein